MEGDNEDGLYGWTSCPLVAQYRNFCCIFNLVLTYFTTNFLVHSATTSVLLNIYSQW